MKTTEKKFYKIGEISKILDLPCSTLRFWEKELSILHPMRNAKNTRYYTLEDLEHLKMIHFLVKERGLKLAAAEKQIKKNRRNVSKVHDVTERLREMREDLLQLSEALNQIP